MDCIDHEFTDEIVCPYCGYEEQDSRELDNHEDVQKCPVCKSKYHWTRDVQITYVTEKDCDLNGVAHQWGKIKKHNCRRYRECETCGRIRFEDDKVVI
jgi:DNA-directed RNA polymerase subunit RPC12/RpoP